MVKFIKPTPSRIAVNIIKGAMAAQNMSAEKVAKMMHVHRNTVSSDFKCPEKIPQDRLWLYFVVLGIDIKGVLLKIQDAVSEMIVNG